jgi:hypothetical protein
MIIIQRAYAVLKEENELKAGRLGIPRKRSRLELGGFAAYTGTSRTTTVSPICTRMVIILGVRVTWISMCGPF